MTICLEKCNGNNGRIGVDQKYKFRVEHSQSHQVIMAEVYKDQSSYLWLKTRNYKQWVKYKLVTRATTLLLETNDHMSLSLETIICLE